MMSKKPKKNTPNIKNIDIKKIISDPYTIPPNLLNILKEHSTGYILFTVDYNGKISFNINADNEILAEGLKNKLADILNADREARQIVLSQIVTQNLLNDIGEDDPEENGGHSGGPEENC